jgi:hypothetical protein
MTTLWNDIVYELNGSCQSLYVVLDRYEAEYLEDNEQFLNYLDQQIFLCESCNWWCEVSEMSDNEHFQECSQCAEYQDD